jgi:hypothetical protein
MRTALIAATIGLLAGLSLFTATAAPRAHAATTAPHVPVSTTTGPVPGSQPYSCAPLPTASVPAGTVLTMSASLGRRATVTLEGTAVYPFFPEPNMYLSHPLLKLVNAGGGHASATLFATDPAEPAPLGLGIGAWQPLGNSPRSTRYSSLCDVHTHNGTVVVVATYNAGCSINCVLNVALYDGFGLIPIAATTELTINGPADIVASGHGAVIVTNDPSFFCTFASCADTAEPVRVMAVGDDGLTNVTHSWPGLIARDAHAWWAWYREGLHQRQVDNEGTLAAWAADECELHRCSTAFARLREIGRLGRLTENGGGGEATAPYLDQLKAFLIRGGYWTTNSAA